MVLAELYAWAYGRDDPTRILNAIETMLRFEVDVISFDAESAEQYGKLRGVLKRQGDVVNPVDLMIASVALAHDLILVTHNTADFQRIPDLSLEDWLAP